MEETIGRIWNGDLRPRHGLGREREEIRHLEWLLEENKKRLKAGLNDEQELRWEKISDCFEEYLELVSGEAFEDGFCLGVKIMAEALLSGKEQG